MIENVKKAASDTKKFSWRLLYLIVFVFIASLVYDKGLEQWERTVKIYAPPWDVRTYYKDGGRTLIFQAVSKKLHPCAVIRDSRIVLGAVIDENGKRRVKQYPAQRLDGEEAIGAPIVLPDGVFIVGPWIVKDTVEVISKITEFKVVLQCQFVGGPVRNATIGPIKIK